MRRATLIAMVIAATAGGWILSGQLGDDAVEPEAATDENTAADVEIPRVRIIDSVAMEHVQEISLFGRTEADRVIDIKAETEGRVVDIQVEEGASVEKGSNILRLAMDDRQSKLMEAEAQVEYREIGYEAAEALAEKNFSAEVTVAEEKAALESAKAALRSIRLDIARTRLKAPFAGIIEELPLETGDLVQIGNTVARLVDLDPITVSVEVTERQISQVRIGQEALVQFANGIERSGNVTFISKSGNDETRTFRVELEISNSLNDVPQGLTAEVTLLTQSVLAHKITPAVLTLNDAGQLGVKIVDESGAVEFLPISVAAETKDGVWVEGLPQSVRLITVGQEFVRHGQTVEAIDANGE